jgi:hypothetical protein
VTPGERVRDKLRRASGLLRVALLLCKEVGYEVERDRQRNGFKIKSDAWETRLRVRYGITDKFAEECYLLWLLWREFGFECRGRPHEIGRVVTEAARLIRAMERRLYRNHPRLRGRMRRKESLIMKLWR